LVYANFNDYSPVAYYKCRDET